MTMLQCLRSFKVLDMAVFDWLATAALAAIIGSKFKQAYASIIIFIILVVMGIIIHSALNRPTMFNAYLGLNSKNAVYIARQTT
jgi:hypothetical protein